MSINLNSNVNDSTEQECLVLCLRFYQNEHWFIYFYDLFILESVDKSDFT